jgi:hypothetical protein
MNNIVVQRESAGQPRELLLYAGPGLAAHVFLSRFFATKAATWFTDPRFFCGRLLILRGDRETLLNEHDQFDHSSGIDDVARQRCIITQCFVSAKKMAPCC